MRQATLNEAIQILRSGGVIAYPTEGVWGIGCDPDLEPAVARILKLKNRPLSKGLIVIAENWQQLAPYLLPLDPEVQERVMPTWPGPVTWVLPAAATCPRWLRGDHTSLAVRVTAHPVCQALCAGLGKPLVSTSANPSNQEPACSAAKVESYFPEGIDALIARESDTSGCPSEIRDGLTGKKLR